MDHNRIAQISLELFKSLPVGGKPNTNEWTVLSTIVKHCHITNSYEVVSLGTGSKCIGAGAMSSRGDILNDSHAEVIARRGFLKYIYYEIEMFLENKKSIFIGWDNDKLILTENISFHMFSSYVPCGDAAIFPKHDTENCGDILEDKNDSYSNLSDNEEETPIKKMKIDDAFRTGAKCLENDTKQDPKQAGTKYHVTGAVRTKPGRGDRTLSLSCTDKIAKWCFVGIQGALLTLLLSKPIYVKSLTIASGVPFSSDAFTRALNTRFTRRELNCPYRYTMPVVVQATNGSCPAFARDDTKRPCPSSLIWYVHCEGIQVVVEGKKQGVTKKNLLKKSARVKICKKELFCTFSKIFQHQSFKFKGNLRSMCYVDLKESASQYQNMWNFVKSDIFKVWTVKNKDLLRFSCEN